MAERWTSNVLCRYFMHGTCRSGAGCCYSHDPNLARPTLPCKFYQCGTCAYGNKCQYLHEDPAAAGQKAAAAANGVGLRTTDTGQPERTAPAGRGGRMAAGRGGGAGQAGRGQPGRAAEVTGPAGRGQTGRSEPAGRGQTGRSEPAGRGQTGRSEPVGRGQTGRSEPVGRGQTGRSEPADRGQTVRSEPADRGQTVRSEPADRGQTGRSEPVGHGQTGRSEPAGRGQTGRSEPVGRGQTGRSEPVGRGQTGRSEPVGRGETGRSEPRSDGRGQTEVGRGQTGRTEQAGRGGQTRQSSAAPAPAGDSLRRPMKELKLCNMTTGARVPVNWADAPEFVPGSGRPPPPEPEVRSYADVTLPADSRRDPDDLQLIPLCPYAAVGTCRYGEHCALLHGDVCEYCQCQVLHPHDPEQQRRHRAECLSTHERDMEHSFRMAKSVEKACGICMEVVVEKKELSTRRFGILPSCSHCFCVACIRQWRSSSQFEPKVTRGCPECRVHSDFICPSRYWVDESEEKTKLIDDYINSCNTKPCKHFNEGRGECPFGNKCFYRHTYPDGRKAELGPPRRRRRQNQFIETELMSDVMLADFLSDEMRAMDDEVAEEAIRLNLMMIQADMMDLMFPSDSEDE